MTKCLSDTVSVLKGCPQLLFKRVLELPFCFRRLGVCLCVSTRGQPLARCVMTVQTV